jgi:hypothetical protein
VAAAEPGVTAAAAAAHVAATATAVSTTTTTVLSECGASNGQERCEGYRPQGAPSEGEPIT